MKPLTNTPINTLNLIKKEKITKIKFKSWENNVEVGFKSYHIFEISGRSKRLKFSQELRHYYHIHSELWSQAKIHEGECCTMPKIWRKAKMAHK